MYSFASPTTRRNSRDGEPERLSASNCIEAELSQGRPRPRSRRQRFFWQYLRKLLRALGSPRARDRIPEPTRLAVGHTGACESGEIGDAPVPG